MKKGKEGKSKLCWNCEGRIGLDLDVCNYCGVSVQPLMLQGMADFSPVYSFDPNKEIKEIPDAPYAPIVEKKEDFVAKEPAVLPVKESKAFPILNKESKAFLIPLITLNMGAVFFLFALALFFFSTGNVLTLQWNSSYWYLYLFIAAPLLLAGFISLQSNYLHSKNHSAK